MSAEARPLTLAPSLETARLTLAAHRVADYDECVSMWSDPLVVRHIGGVPFSPPDVWSKVLRYAGHWQLLGFGYWVVREKATGRFVGEVGFADFKRAIVPSIAGLPEAGWVLASWAHGQGFATEAVTAIVAWGDAHFGRARTACIIDAHNLASIRVARKCGFEESVRTTYSGSSAIICYRDPAAEGFGSVRP